MPSVGVGEEEEEEEEGMAVRIVQQEIIIMQAQRPDYIRALITDAPFFHM